ncbi:MAG: hypothetical protein U0271_32925 [Polyangiaceae bacterium]
MSSSTRRALGVAAALVGLSSLGCVEVQRMNTRIDERVLSREQVSVATERFEAHIDQVGNTLRVRVQPECALVEEETIQYRDVVDKRLRDEDVAWMTALAVLGAAPLITATALLADAPNVYPNDPNARLYNYAGQDTIIAIGVVLGAVGLAAVLPPMVNGLRAVGSEGAVSEQKRQGATIRPEAPCRGSELPPVYRVLATTGNQSIVIGGARANLDTIIDLKAALGEILLGLDQPPSRVSIWINDKYLIDADVTGVLAEVRADRAAADDAAWRSAEPEACAKNPSACSAVQLYLARFPNGRHADEARRILGERLAVARSADPALRLQQARDAAVAASSEAVRKAMIEADKDYAAAREKAAKDGTLACERACDQVCETDSSCREQCITAECR